MIIQGQLLRSLIPARSLKLGWIVSNVKDPLQLYYHSDDDAPGQIVVPVHSFQDSIENERKIGFGSFLSQLFSSMFNIRSSTSVTISADEAISEMLPNSDTWYERLCESPQLRQWLEHRIEKNQNPHMIVAIHTLKNAKCTLRQSAGSQIEAEITVPLAAILGLPGTLDALVDPGLNAIREGARGTEQRLETTDIIYAIQYRKISFKWFFSRDKPLLSPKTSWQVSLWRGEQSPDEEDVVQSVLEGVEEGKSSSSFDMDNEHALKLAW